MAGNPQGLVSSHLRQRRGQSATASNNGPSLRKSSDLIAGHYLATPAPRGESPKEINVTNAEPHHAERGSRGAGQQRSPHVDLPRNPLVSQEASQQGRPQVNFYN
jgi:hypothetical protein